MKRICVCVATVLVLTLGQASKANAGWSEWCYSGYQPWWNIFAKRYKCLTPEEERLQKFWHDYYDAMKNYYSALDKIDWVAYYKNHGYQINGAACGPYGGGRINYAPVFVSPGLQWAVPQAPMQGPPSPVYGGQMMPASYSGQAPNQMPAAYAGQMPPQTMPAGYPGLMPLACNGLLVGEFAPHQSRPSLFSGGRESAVAARTVLITRCQLTGGLSSAALTVSAAIFSPHILPVRSHPSPMLANRTAIPRCLPSVTALVG